MIHTTDSTEIGLERNIPAIQIQDPSRREGQTQGCTYNTGRGRVIKAELKLSPHPMAAGVGDPGVPDQGN